MTKSPAKPRKKTERPYGLWRSQMAPQELLSQPSAPMYPFRHRGRLYWLEALTEEGGRIALMTQRKSGANSGESRCLTPAPFNIRTSAHEYGGRCFCVFGERIVFNNFADGRVYRQDLCAVFPAGTGGGDSGTGGRPDGVLRRPCAAQPLRRGDRGDGNRRRGLRGSGSSGGHQLVRIR